MTQQATPPLHAASRLLHADRVGGVEHGAVHKPLHAAVAYGYPSARALADVFQGNAAGFIYGRQGNPSTAALEAKLNILEGDARGSVTFATGMGAITGLMLALLRAGDHVVASRFLFGNTASWLATLARLGVAVTLVDATEAGNVRDALTPATRLVLVETIANPRTQVADLAAIGELCAARGIVYLVDSTMTTPALLTGRDVGASLVMHSLSKSISGHGNALGGSVTDTGLFDWSTFPSIDAPYRKGNPQMWGLTQIKKKGLRDVGATLSSDHAHRIAMGMETLGLRMQRACANTQALAEWLERHPKVARVHYPGLASHPQHERAKALFRGYGALLSFETAPGVDLFALLDALQLVIKSSHLGDNRTMALPAAHTIFHEMGADSRASMGIADELIRVSVGIEEPEDLLADFAQAFERS